MNTSTQIQPMGRLGRYGLSLVAFFLLIACSLPTALGAPSGLVLVTPNPAASLTATPFQPAATTLEPPTLVSTFTPLPPTDTPLPTLEFTATTLASPTAPAVSARTQYT